jgi:hypothetical protein
MGTGLEGPTEIAGKLVFIVVRRGVQRKKGSEESLAGSAGKTDVAANGEAELIRIGEAVAYVAGKAAIQEGVVDALAVGMGVGASDGVVEFVEESADLGSATSGRKATALGEEIDFGNARGTLMANDLNDAGHGVGAIEGALGAVNELDFVDVIEREIGVDQVAAGEIHGSAVHEHFGKAGIAAVNEDGREATDRTGSSETDARLRGEKVWERDGLALLDFLAADEIDRSGGVVEIQRLGIGGDDDVFRDALYFETKIECAAAARSRTTSWGTKDACWK